MTALGFIGGLRREDAVIAPMIALSLAAVLAMSGLATDAAVWFAQHRDLQSATDAAALAGAGALAQGTSAATAANAIVTANNFTPSSTVVSLQTGFYCPGEPTPAQRFIAGSTTACPTLGASPDAVQVTTHRTAQTYLLSALGTPGSTQPFVMNTVATATTINEAGLSVASGLASLNNGVVNGVLSSLTGSTVSLSAVQYTGLANANIDALSFLNALHTQVGGSAGTYNQLLTSGATVGQVLSAAASVLASQGQVANANAVSGLAALQTAVTGQGVINLSNLFDLGVWGDSPVNSGTPPSALHAGVDLYQLVTASLQVANGTNAIAIPASGLSIPGLAALTVSGTAIQAPQQAAFAFGPVGLSVHTAQVTLNLNLRILQTAGGSLIQVPLNAQVAAGTATIAAISCNGNANQTTVTVDTTTGVAYVYIGTPGSSPTNPTPATILGVPGLLSLTASASAPPLAQGSGAPVFSQPAANSPPTIGTPPWNGSAGAQGVPAETTSSVTLAALGSSLNSNLQVSACVTVICVPTIPSALTSALTPVLNNLDGVINPLLFALGVNIGYMYTGVTGVRCGYPVLVY